MRTRSPPSATRGRRFDDTPEGFDPTSLPGQEPERDYTPNEDDGVDPLRPRRPSALRDREPDRSLHGRPRHGGRLRRLPGAGCRGPRRGQRALGELPPLPAGDLRPERRRVATSRPAPLPALRPRGLVMVRRRGAGRGDVGPTLGTSIGIRTNTEDMDNAINILSSTHLARLQL